MNIRLSKDKFIVIENAFEILKNDKSNQMASQMIEHSLNDTFKGCVFEILIMNSDDSFFVMSVFPELSVLDKIMECIMSNKETEIIQNLWETNKRWRIEIDNKILDKNIIDFSKEELTSILLHEIGHIVCSTSIPNRLSLILRYEVLNSKLTNKMIIKDSMFSRIFSLPILDACIADSKRTSTSIKEEIKADKFVKKMGYSQSLYSALTKLIQSKSYKNVMSIDDKLIKGANISDKILDDLYNRRDELAKHKLFSIKRINENSLFDDVLTDVMESVLDINTRDSRFNEKKQEHLRNRMDKLVEEGYYTEFALIRKNLQRIDPNEIDYINCKINDMTNESDRLMVVSYIHNKLDLVEYYISILKNPKYSIKYNIPHSLNQLEMYRIRLLELRKNALSFKLPEKQRALIVVYPDGYEG